MTAQQLKNSILQLAIQGKLVPQDPNDEPASVLLERIRQEKENLVKQGKIKRDKNPSVIFRGADNITYEKTGLVTRAIDDELPFEIPESWAWVRPNDLGYFGSGKTPQNTELCHDGQIPYYKVSDMNTHGNEELLSITDNYLIPGVKVKSFPAGTIVFPKNGGALFTNKKRILQCESLVDLNTGTYTQYLGVYPRFLFYLFSTIDFKEHYKGTALPTVDMDSVLGLFWGLPPYNEQIRIVSKIESLLPHLKALE